MEWVSGSGLDLINSAHKALHLKLLQISATMCRGNGRDQGLAMHKKLEFQDAEDGAKVPRPKRASVSWTGPRFQSLLDQDTDAQELFVRQTGGYVMSTLRRYLKCNEDIKDCAQETYLRAFNKLDTFRQDSDITTWLVSIARNCALTRLRGEKHRVSCSETADVDELEYNQYGFLVFPVTAALPSTQQVTEERDMQRLVRQTIEGLPEIYRGIVMLRDIEGYSIKEVARQLAISESAVKVRLLRARLMLRQQLVDVFEEYMP